MRLTGGSVVMGGRFGGRDGNGKRLLWCGLSSMHCIYGEGWKARTTTTSDLETTRAFRDITLMNLQRVLAVAFAALTICTPASAVTVSTFAGTGQKGNAGDGGPAAKAQFDNVFGIVRGPDKALYVCDTMNHQVRRIAPDGKISTVAGNGTKGYSGDGGPATKAQLNEPYEVRFDLAGNLVFIERLNQCVRRVDMKSGVISTVAGTGGKAGFGGDGGPATAALFSQPHSLALDRDGNIYV